MTIDARYCCRCGSALEERELGGRTRRVCTAESCSFVWWDNPVPVVAAIVEHQDAIVLVRNVGWPEKMFGLVTGFLERSESPEEGIRREIKEELSLETKASTLIGVYPFEQQNQVIIAYHAACEGVIERNEELAAHKHITAEKLRPWPFGTGKAVAHWLETRRRS